MGFSSFFEENMLVIQKYCYVKIYKIVQSKTRTYYERVGSGRTAGRRGGAGQNGTPTEQFAQKTSVARTLQGIEYTSSERFSRSTNKRNPMLTDGGTQRAVDERLISGLSAGQEALFVPGCWPVDRHIFVFVNLFHARHVREPKLTVFVCDKMSEWYIQEIAGCSSNNNHFRLLHLIKQPRILIPHEQHRWSCK